MELLHRFLRRFKTMPLLFSRAWNQRDRGQITVFLSLIFLLMTGLVFCVLEGIREYEISALAEDAMEGAGKEVLANYDRQLFLRYDLFFLDPREKKRMRKDGMDYVNRYFTEGEFFGMKCRSISPDQYVSAMDQSAKPLKKEIHEWADCMEKGGREDPVSRNDGDGSKDRMIKMRQSFSRKYPKISHYISEIHEVWGEKIPEEPDLPLLPDPYAPDQENPPILPGIKEVNAWKEICETLEGTNIEDCIYNMVSKGGGMSGLIMDTSRAPSKETGVSSASEDYGGLESLRSDSLKPLASYFPSIPAGSTEDEDQEESILMTYIHSHFFNYMSQDPEKVSDSGGRRLPSGPFQTDRRVLRYEEEYLIGGEPDDESNLRSVMRRIFRWRFLMNYDYARSAGPVEREAEKIAADLTGQEGFYSNQEAGTLFLIGTAAYGQTLIDLSRLLRGEALPLIPNQNSWKTDLYHFSELTEAFGEKESGKGELFYNDYLNLFLYEKSGEHLILFRMMDIMQSNIRLSEPDFAMKNALYSFRWKGVILSTKWFPSIPVFRLSSPGTEVLEFQKVNSY